MNESSDFAKEKSKAAANRLLESGIIFSAISFLTGLVNFAFQGLIGRQLTDPGEFGLANNTTTFIGFLGLPLAIVTTAVTHYIAHFHANDDQARLRGLLRGCRKILLQFTVGGCLLAVVLAKPLSVFFNFPRTGLIVVALFCVLVGLWGSFVTALCQGLSWFKRLAIIGLLGAVLRWGFTWWFTLQYPRAEYAVAATGVATLASIVLLGWILFSKRELFHHEEAISPWDREFIRYLLTSAACVGGTYFFLQSDQLVSQRYFNPIERDLYSTANRLASALPMVAGPLLIVLFTSRSKERSVDARSAQLKLLGLYAAGLCIGFFGLLLCRNLCVRLILGKEAPEAAAMIFPLALTMVFAGGIQALGMFALASRWLKTAWLYGGLGVVYWVILLVLGTTPQRLLMLMPVVAGAALIIQFLVSWIGMKRRSLFSAQSG